MKKLLTGAVSISLLLSPALPVMAEDVSDAEIIDATTSRGNFRVRRTSRRRVVNSVKRRRSSRRGTTANSRRSRNGRATDRRVHNKVGDGDASCISVAITARETAIMAAWDMLSMDMMKVLEMRKSDLEAAWMMDNSSERRTALQKAWSMFKEGRKMARTTARDSRRSAWQTYKTAARNCGVSTTEEGSGESVDGEL